MEERTKFSIANNLKIVNYLNSIFSCPTFLCPVPLPHIKLVTDPNYDITSICFICQMKRCLMGEIKLFLPLFTIEILITFPFHFRSKPKK